MFYHGLCTKQHQMAFVTSRIWSTQLWKVAFLLTLLVDFRNFTCITINVWNRFVHWRISTRSYAFVWFLEVTNPTGKRVSKVTEHFKTSHTTSTLFAGKRLPINQLIILKLLWMWDSTWTNWRTKRTLCWRLSSSRTWPWIWDRPYAGLTFPSSYFSVKSSFSTMAFLASLPFFLHFLAL